VWSVDIERVRFDFHEFADAHDFTPAGRGVDGITDGDPLRVEDAWFGMTIPWLS